MSTFPSIAKGIIGWLGLFTLLFLGKAQADVTHARHQPGDTYRLKMATNLKGWYAQASSSVATSKKEFTETGRVVFQERILPPTAPATQERLFRVYETSHNRRQDGDVAQTNALRPQVSRVILDPIEAGYVAYSPDLSLQFHELATIDEHPHLPAIEALIEGGALKPGRTWTAPESALKELTGVDAVTSGSVICRVEGERDIQKRKLLQISLSGDFQGRTGPLETRIQLKGGIYLSPETGRFVALKVLGNQETREMGTVTGSLEVDYQVVAEAVINSADLSDAAVARVPPSATDAMLMIDCDLVALGLQLTHPRRWILQRIDGPRVYFAGPDVSFVITLETPGKVPTNTQFLAQVSDYLKQNKIEVIRVPMAAGQSGDHFQFQGTFKNRPTLLDYWIVRQMDRGATIAANSLTPVDNSARKELEDIVGSIKLSAPVAAQK